MITDKPCVRDYDVPHGFVIGSFYQAIFQKILTFPIILLLTICFHGPGLVRSMTKNFGSFFIIGTRHSCQSSRVMGQTKPKLHHYSNAGSTKLSLLPMVRSVINMPSYQAHKMQSSSGEIMESLLHKSIADEPNDVRADANNHGPSSRIPFPIAITMTTILFVRTLARHGSLSCRQSIVFLLTTSNVILTSLPIFLRRKYFHYLPPVAGFP